MISGCGDGNDAGSGGAAGRSQSSSAQASRIVDIAPSCAAVGEEVSIEGKGLGGRNVRITVAGLAAEVVAASGRGATFLVPAGAPPGATTVTARGPALLARLPNLSAGSPGSAGLPGTVALGMQITVKYAMGLAPMNG